MFIKALLAHVIIASHKNMVEVKPDKTISIPTYQKLIG